MVSKEKNESRTLIKSVFVAYFILLLHVVLIAGLGVLVLFFRGIVNYMMGIFIVGSATILISAYLFYKRMKAEGRTLREILRSPMFRGRTVEVNLLGGLASFRIGGGNEFSVLESNTADVSRQLEDPSTVRMRELSEMARLFENDLITLDEFDKAKKEIFRP